MGYRACAATLLLALAGGCASARPSVGYLGTGMCPAQGGIALTQVLADSPADKAGLRDGDLLVEYRDLPLVKLEDRRTLLWDIRNGAGKPIRLSLTRGTKRRTYTVRPKRRDLTPKDELYAALMDEIMTGKPIAIAVIVSQLNHTSPQFFANAGSLEAWKEGMRGHLEIMFEGMLLNKLFFRCGNYSLADREKTEQVLRELHFQMTGAVSAGTTKDVGKMLGASHLLFVNSTRYSGRSGGYEDDIQTRLVAVESDAVLAAIRFRQTVKP